MPRYCVTVTRPEAHFVDAESMAEAAELGIMAVVERARPAYYLAPQAEVEQCAEPQNGPQSRQIAASVANSCPGVVSTRKSHRRAVAPVNAKSWVPHVV